MASHFIINDETKRDILFPNDKYTGLDLSARPRGANVYGALADPFPAEMMIPKSDWQGIIQEQEQRKIRIIDMCDENGLKRKNQGQLGYCWVFSPVVCMEILRVKMNEPYISLSPASAGARIKNFRNVGGWGREAVEWLSTNGCDPSSVWPDTSLSRKYDTAENEATAKKYLVTEWWELAPNNIDQIISLILRGFPVSGGFDWWGHQITLNYCTWIDGEVGIGFDNSWGDDWGDHGRGVLQGNRRYPSDAVAPRDVTAIAA
jgi:hypothetical protein